MLNKLTDSNIYVADQLFATLDPTTRQLTLPMGQQIVLTDTVGFIQKLPTDLVAAFRATLEEISEADLLIHVVDISQTDALLQRKTVLETLSNIGAGNIPVITVYNKIDRLDEETMDFVLPLLEPQPFLISALNGTGLDKLVDSISEQLYARYERVTVMLPYEHGNLVSIFHEKGHVNTVEHLPQGIRISGLLPREIVTQFGAYLVHGKTTNHPVS